MAYVGIQQQTDAALFGPTDYTIAAGGKVNFNTNLDYFKGTDSFITYDNNTFEFTFTKAGYYYVSWFVVLQSAFSTSGPTFTLVSKTGTEVALYPSSSSFKTGTMYGSAVVIAQAGTTMSLRNDTGAVAIFANNTENTNGTSIVSNISVTRYVQDVSGVEVGLTGGTSVANGAIVPFNTQVSTITSPVVTNTEGVFTLNQAGVYLFDWMVSIDGITATSREIRFELIQGGTTVVGSSVSPVVNQGFITGTAVVSATAGQTFSLYNNTVDNTTPTPLGVTILYSDLSIQAYMRIVTLI